ncbi:MAG: cytochrome c biogenesis protein ResB [Candidatus Aminicenantales bacterium]
MRSAWKFLSSIKLAIVLIILLTVASIVGTLIPQGRSVAEYSARYGSLSGLFTALRLTRLYQSVWYLALLLLFAANTIVCTLSRLGPKWRRVFHAAPEADAKSVTSMRASARFRLPLTLAAARDRVTRRLRARRYRVDESAKGEKISLLARKRRLGWFGSDVVHLGLLVIIAGGFTSGLGSRRAELSLTDGQTADVPHAAFQLRLDKFDTEYYPQGGVKDWKSTVSVIEGGAPVLTRIIEVNEPLTYKGISVYQQSYGWDWTRSRVVLELRKPGDPAVLKTMTLDVGQSAAVESPDVTSVVVRRFVPDFVIGEGNEIQSRSEDPNNPAALVEAWKGEERVFSGWIFAKFPDFGQGHGNDPMSGARTAAAADAPKLAVILKDYSAAPYSVLEAAQDPGANLIWLGCLLVSGGFFLAFYWPPREIRVVLEGSQGKVDLAAGGHAAKSREAFQAEFDGIFESIRRPE